MNLPSPSEEDAFEGKVLTFYVSRVENVEFVIGSVPLCYVSSSTPWIRTNPTPDKTDPAEVVMPLSPRLAVAISDQQINRASVVYVPEQFLVGINSMIYASSAGIASRSPESIVSLRLLESC